MPPTKDRYHHGALREELLRASLQLIEAEGLAAVSLRRVAREAGVSPGAPYHHFTDRAALLSALSVQGFRLLADQLRSAHATTTAPMERLRSMAEAYVRFAWDQPAYFRLMFRPELSQPDRHPDAEAAGDAAYTVLADTINEAVEAGALPSGAAAEMAIGWWSLAHGLASLALDGQLTKRAAQLGTDPRTLAASITRMFADFAKPSPSQAE
jgi:AcrR family transcriptional regulator